MGALGAQSALYYFLTYNKLYYTKLHYNKLYYTQMHFTLYYILHCIKLPYTTWGLQQHLQFIS